MEFGDYEDLPTCPHCKHEDVDWWDGLGEKHDGDEWDVTCAICDKQYTVSMCITTTFATKEASND